MDCGAGSAAAAASATASSFAPIQGGDAPVAGDVDQFYLLKEQQKNGCVVALATCLRTLCVRTLALVSRWRLAAGLPPVPLYAGSP